MAYIGGDEMGKRHMSRGSMSPEAWRKHKKETAAIHEKENSPEGLKKRFGKDAKTKALKSKM